MTELLICPCEGFTHPQLIFNPPGRNAIAYRIGDYSSFRHALLLPLKDVSANLIENELANWNPSAEGDLAVQLVEWWAYLADILTFYSDRIANESYLRTADLPESVQRLVRILGYRPRPGIGASGIVAAIANNSKPFSLPQGFQIQSKPSQGKQPQIFELDADTLIQFPGVIAAEPLPNTNLIPNSLLLKGTVTTVKVGDQLLLLKRNWNGTDQQYALATVQSVKSEKDPQGKINTRLNLTLQKSGVPASAQVQDYRLLKSSQSAHLYAYKTNHAIFFDHLHLESIQRNIKAGDPLLLENPAQNPKYRLVTVSKYAELLWYANTPNSANPSQSPNPATEPAVPILHTRLHFLPSLSSTIASQWDVNRDKVSAHLNWQEVGQLIDTATENFNSTSPILKLVTPVKFPASSSSLVSLLLEDAESQGIAAKGELDSTADLLNLSGLQPASLSLKSPLSVLFNLLSVSRGQTVPVEILGSGNASLAGQEFVIKKSPLTYLLSDDSSSGGNYKSTLRIWVDGIEWQEVPSFYGQSPDASVFVTREDENQQTHVQFGDRINGARLTSGVNNVVAKYRYGSGKDAPDAGALSVIVKPYPNLKSIRNPVPVGGGADPEPSEQIRRYAPQSVLTFGRAVSGDDYETIAAQTPGVSRAKIYWTWDTTQQRSLVKLYVGDDNSAVSAAKIALKGSADPNRSVAVELAQPRPIRVSLTLRIEASRIPETVIAAAQDALLNPDNGLFGANAIQIGQAIYQSQIYAVCMKVPGVLAVHGLEFWINFGIGFTLDTHFRHDPGEGRFYLLTNLSLDWEVG
jgi:hypothetical protein